MINKVIDWVVDNRVLLLYGLLAAAVTFLLYLYRLGSFVRGDSVYESKPFLEIESVQAIIDSVSMAPVKIVEFIMVKIDDPNSTLLRIISVAIVLLAAAAFYRLIAKWHTHRIALLATLLFITSSYSLHLGRFTNQDSLYYVIFPALILFGTWLKSKKYVVRLPFIFPALALFLYVPGFIYSILLLLIIFRKRLLLAWKFVDIRKNIISLAVSALLLVPLIYALAVRPSQLYEYLAIDRLTGPNGLAEFGKTLADIPDALFYSGPEHAYRWLTGTPVLDVASIALLVLGIYGSIRGPHPLRARAILLFALVSIFIIGSGSLVSLAILIPLLYIVIANGIVFLLQSWFTVFPRNPAARNTALALIAIFIALICSYQLQRYFIAWPNAPETKSSLSAKAE